MKFRRAVDVVVTVLAIDAGVAAIQSLSRRVGLKPADPLTTEQVVGHRLDAPGIDAESPSEIPLGGWKQVGKRVLSGFSEDRVMAEAASVTYYALLAIFPALAALVSIYGLIAEPADIGRNLNSVAGVIPGGGMQLISDQVHALVSAPKKGLGIGLVVGLLTSLWSANAGMKSLFDALNAVYEEKEKRGFLHLTWLSLAFTMGAIVFVILALTAVVVVPAVLSYVGLGSVSTVLLSVGRWPLLLVCIVLLLALIYRYGPSRTKAKWRWVSWGSAFASVFWLVASLAFSWYAANFGSYNKTYGALGAVVGFMTWIWISAIIVLTGGELNAELEHQTARDSTEGGDKPLGTRGAVRADKVAAS